jgi:YVTN family beta-propeller protein
VVTPTAMYVASQAAGTVTVINPSSSKITATVTVGDSPYGIAVSPRFVNGPRAGGSTRPSTEH